MVVVRSVKANLRGIARPAAHTGKPSGLKVRTSWRPLATSGTAAKPPASWKYC
jgi:hypothetical protein